MRGPSICSLDFSDLKFDRLCLRSGVLSGCGWQKWSSASESRRTETAVSVCGDNLKGRLLCKDILQERLARKPVVFPEQAEGLARKWLSVLSRHACKAPESSASFILPTGAIVGTMKAPGNDAGIGWGADWKIQAHVRCKSSGQLPWGGGNWHL